MTNYIIGLFAIGLGIEIGGYIVYALKNGWREWNRIDEELDNCSDVIEVRWSVREQ